jgi:hypothetical protein
MKLKRLSSVARSVDLAYPTNRAIVIISLLFFLGTACLQLILGRETSSASASGLRAGASVFLAWAFARELDPDNEFSAFVAAFLGFAGFLLFPSPFLLALFLELLLIRIINRSTGLPAKTSDSFAILLLSGWISFQGEWAFGLFTTLAFLLDSSLPEPNRCNRIFGGIAFMISLLAFTGTAGKESILMNTQLGLFAFAATLLFIPRILRSGKIKSRGDLTGNPLDPLRVQAAQLIALLNAILYTALKGWAGIESLMPLWGAILGVALYGNLKVLLKRLSKTPLTD